MRTSTKNMHKAQNGGRDLGSPPGVEAHEVSHSGYRDQTHGA
jgi:hypothetical protein